MRSFNFLKIETIWRKPEGLATKKMRLPSPRLWIIWLSLWGCYGCNPLKFDSLRSENPVLASNLEQTTLTQVWEYDIMAGLGADPFLVLGDKLLVSTLKGEVHGLKRLSQASQKGGIFSKTVFFQKQGFIALTEGIRGKPILLGDMILVTGASGSKPLVAYHLLTAQKIWARKTKSAAIGLWTNGKTVIGVTQEGEAFSIQPETGQDLWRKPLWKEHTSVLAQLAGEGETLFAINDQGGALAFNLKNGETLWEKDLHQPVWSDAAWTKKVWAIPTMKGQVWGLNPENGTIRWRFTQADSTLRFAALSADSKALFFGDSNGALRKLDLETGQLLWETSTDGAFVAAPLVLEKQGFIGGMDKQLYVFSTETGQIQAQYPLKGRVKSKPLQWGDWLILGVEPNRLVAFRASFNP